MASWSASFGSYDQAHRMDAEEAHWISIHLMNINAQLVHRWDFSSIMTEQPELWKASLSQDSRTVESRVTILKPYAWLRAQGDSLEPSWSVTSDSISAHVAKVLSVNELVLLKSCLPMSSLISDWAEEGQVDQAFPRTIDRQIPVRWIDLFSGEELVGELE